MISLNPVLMAAEESVDLVDISILNSSVVAVLGYTMIFFGLILLMTVIIALGKLFAGKKKKAAEAELVATPVAAPVQAPTAPGAAGQLKLYNVEPKTAAMLMAIVANKMGKPLNELRFISIKEVE